MTSVGSHFLPMLPNMKISLIFCSKLGRKDICMVDVWSGSLFSGPVLWVLLYSELCSERHQIWCPVLPHLTLLLLQPCSPRPSAPESPKPAHVAQRLPQQVLFESNKALRIWLPLSHSLGPFFKVSKIGVGVCELSIEKCYCIREIRAPLGSRIWIRWIFFFISSLVVPSCFVACVPA